MSTKITYEDRRTAEDLLAFIRKAPTAYHAVDAVKAMLPDYTLLSETKRWHLAAGGKYIVTRNDSSLIAFHIPENADITAFHIIASHNDSPTYKIKKHADLPASGSAAGHYIRLDTEPYGGVIAPSWMDRPLSVAGRVLVREGDTIRSRLVKMDRDMLVIPNVAIHMNREINDGFRYDAHIDLMPLWGDGDAKGSFYKTIADELGIEQENVLGSDLILYNRTPGCIWGADDAFFSCGRLDNMESVYASVLALKGADAGMNTPASHINVCAVFDNEEVGSNTKQGADSTFLSDVLERIILSLGGGEEDYQTALAKSMMLSTDNAHATHPNHPEHADPVNQVWMNEGIVIKSHAGQKYSTDGVSAAIFSEICRRAEVPVQFFANRSDKRSGSTLGNISGRHVSIRTVDIGLAQLAMHSAWETAGTKDPGYMIRGMQAFYDAEIQCNEDGSFTLKDRFVNG